MQQETLEIHIQGRRKGCPLQPDMLDIQEWIGMLESGRDLLYPTQKQSKRAEVHVQPEQGSVRLLLMTAATAVMDVHNALAEVQASKNLSKLPHKQAAAVRYFYHLALKENLEIDLKAQSREERALHLDPKTKLDTESRAWVHTEMRIKGKVTSLGGKSKPAIKLEHDQLGPITIKTTKERLAEEPANRLYRTQHLRVRIRQDAYTGEYDTAEAELIEFVDYDMEETTSEYLQRLIEQATPYWDDVDDVEAWLREIRGLDDD